MKEEGHLLSEEIRIVTSPAYLTTAMIITYVASIVLIIAYTSVPKVYVIHDNAPKGTPNGIYSQSYLTEGPSLLSHYSVTEEERVP